jgi:hypothetical protein
MKKLIPAVFLLITFAGALFATAPIPLPDPELALHTSARAVRFIPPAPLPDPELAPIQLSR